MGKNTEKKQKRIYNKGDFGYLRHYKKRQLILAALSILMVAVICLTGIILYHSQKTIFAVMAALAALPAAKLLTGYLVIMPYDSVREEVRERLDGVRGDNKYDKIIYDVVLSSKEKAMCAGVVFIKNGRIFGYTDYYRRIAEKSSKGINNKGRINKNNAKGSDGKIIALRDIESHLKFIVNSNCNYSAIKMFDDENEFLRAVEGERTRELNAAEEEKKKIINMNERIAKQILLYMF